MNSFSASGLPSYLTQANSWMTASPQPLSWNSFMRQVPSVMQTSKLLLDSMGVSLWLSGGSEMYNCYIPYIDYKTDSLNPKIIWERAYVPTLSVNVDGLLVRPHGVEFPNEEFLATHGDKLRPEELTVYLNKLVDIHAG